MVVLGKNQLPRFFSPTDIEHLERCVCGSSNTQTKYEEFGLAIEFCRDCGIARTNPRLKQSAIQRCYEMHAKDEGIFDILFESGKTRRFGWRDALTQFRALSPRLRNLFPPGATPRLLEVGFGDGAFISQLKLAGFDVHGFDISETGVRKLKKKGIAATFAESLSGAAFPSGSFDMLVMWEVFEHIPEPDVFAAEVFRIIKPGGFWFLQVPNWRWLDFKARVVSKLPGSKSYLSKYGCIGPLFHLYHYSHESLTGVISKQGFKFHLSIRIRPYGESNWTALIAHEIFYLLDTIPATLSGNRKHHNVVLGEFYQKPIL